MPQQSEKWDCGTTASLGELPYSGDQMKSRKVFILLLVSVSLALGIGITLAVQAVISNGSLTTRYAHLYQHVFAGRQDCLHDTQFDPSHGALVNVVPWGDLGAKILIVSNVNAKKENLSALYFQVSSAGPSVMVIASSQTARFLESHHCKGVTRQICAPQHRYCY